MGETTSSGPPGDEEPQSDISRALEGASDAGLELLAAYIKGLEEMGEPASPPRVYEEPSASEKDKTDVEKRTITRVASVFRDFLGNLDFGPENHEHDPLYGSSMERAATIIPRVGDILRNMHLPGSLKTKRQILDRANEEAAGGLLDYSGMPDQEQDEDFSNHPIVRRARQHAPKIVVIIAGTVGVATVIYKIKHAKEE